MKYYLPLLLLLFLFACGASEKGQQQKGTDSSGTNTAEVKSWLEKLGTIKNNEYFLEVSGDVVPGPFNDRKFEHFSAGKLSGKRRFVTVLAEYQFDLNELVSSLQLLVTFTPDGKEIARHEVGTLRLKEVGGMQELRSWPMFINDTTIEVREERLEGKSMIRRIELAADGTIRVLPLEKSSFDEYAARFPVLQLPLAIGGSGTSKLRKVSPLTPWFSYQDVIGYNKLDIYHYGKIALPGKLQLLLYAYGPTNDEGAIVDSAVKVVACKSDGSITDEKDLYGKFFGEGVERRWRDAVLHEDGNITVKESIVNTADMVLWEMGSTEIRHMTYRLDAAGKFQPEVRGITFTVPAYSVSTLREVFQNNKEQFARTNGDHLTEMLFGIQDRMPFGVLVWVHFYQHDQQQLAELFTTDDTGKVLDRYVLYNYPEASAYQAVKIPMDGGDDKAHPATNLTGPVTIQLGATTLQVTPEGKFIKP